MNISVYKNIIDLYLAIRACSSWSTDYCSNMEKIISTDTVPPQSCHIYEVANAISRTPPIRPSRFLEDKKWPPQQVFTRAHHFQPYNNNNKILQLSNSPWTPKLRSFNNHDHLHPLPPVSSPNLFEFSRCFDSGSLLQRPSTEVSLFLN